MFVEKSTKEQFDRLATREEKADFILQMALEEFRKQTKDPGFKKIMEIAQAPERLGESSGEGFNSNFKLTEFLLRTAFYPGEGEFDQAIKEKLAETLPYRQIVRRSPLFKMLDKEPEKFLKIWENLPNEKVRAEVGPFLMRFFLSHADLQNLGNLLKNPDKVKIVPEEDLKPIEIPVTFEASSEPPVVNVPIAEGLLKASEQTSQSLGTKAPTDEKIILSEKQAIPFLLIAKSFLKSSDFFVAENPSEVLPVAKLWTPRLSRIFLQNFIKTKFHRNRFEDMYLHIIKTRPEDTRTELNPNFNPNKAESPYNPKYVPPDIAEVLREIKKREN